MCRFRTHQHWTATPAGSYAVCAVSIVPGHSSAVLTTPDWARTTFGHSPATSWMPIAMSSRGSSTDRCLHEGSSRWLRRRCLRHLRVRLVSPPRFRVCEGRRSSCRRTANPSVNRCMACVYQLYASQRSSSPPSWRNTAHIREKRRSLCDVAFDVDSMVGPQVKAGLAPMEVLVPGVDESVGRKRCRLAAGQRVKSIRKHRRTEACTPPSPFDHRYRRSRRSRRSRRRDRVSRSRRQPQLTGRVDEDDVEKRLLLRECLNVDYRPPSPVVLLWQPPRHSKVEGGIYC
jgi:hypothetical protein